MWNVGFQDLKLFWDMDYAVIEDILKSNSVNSMINSKDAHFDLLICEGFFGYEALFAFGHRYNASIIAVSSLGSTIYMNPHIGNPILTASYPNFLLPYTHNMALHERFHNSLLNFVTLLATTAYQLPNQQELVDRYFTESFKQNSIEPISLNQLVKEVDLVFINRHPVLGFPRPHIPNVIDIAGLHLHKFDNNSNVDKELMKIMDDAISGFVYFSFGSNVNMAKMPEQQKSAFMKAFSRIPQTVLVRWDEVTIPDRPKNVYFRKWFPQQEILGHKNCKAFITHGGMLSIEEAVYNAVPIIGVAFFGDQPMNVLRAEQLGFGLRLEYDNVTETSLYWALNEIITSTSYTEVAEKVSSIFRDSPQSPLDRAVYWVEYVLKHNGAAHLKCHARHLNWIQYTSIDVVALAIFIIYLIFYCIRKIYSILLSSNSSKRSKHKQQ
ncbi:UDP-glycosyltransferase UGT5 isoform X2 [Nilaparvata lugens]|nr:UDP-glycosyltransferase UGT5 isoform X2 [Nilaparvata lugens]